MKRAQDNRSIKTDRIDSQAAKELENNNSSSAYPSMIQNLVFIGILVFALQQLRKYFASPLSHSVAISAAADTMGSSKTIAAPASYPTVKPAMTFKVGNLPLS